MLAIGTGGANIPVDKALEHVYGYAVGLDMTRRDLQLEARDKGRPWEFGKSFARSAPFGAIHRAQDIGHPPQARSRSPSTGSRASIRTSPCSSGRSPSA